MSIHSLSQVFQIIHVYLLVKREKNQLKLIIFTHNREKSSGIKRCFCKHRLLLFGKIFKVNLSYGNKGKIKAFPWKLYLFTINMFQAIFLKSKASFRPIKVHHFTVFNCPLRNLLKGGIKLCKSAFTKILTSMALRTF